jgi:putative ABC transport system permease protein
MTWIRIAWRNLWRQKTRSAVVLTAMALGLAGGIVCLSLFTGMSDTRIHAGIATETGHVQIHHPDFLQQGEITQTFSGSRVSAALQARDASAALSLQLSLRGMAASAHKTIGAEIRGVEADAFGQVSDLPQKIIKGQFFDGKKNRAVIGQRLADKLGLRLKQKLVLTFTDNRGNLTGGAFKIVGLFQTSNSRFDEGHILVQVADLRRLTGLDQDRWHRGVVRAAAENNSSSLAATLQEDLDGLDVQHWRQLAPELGAIDGFLSLVSLVFMGIIFFALGFGILNTMRMSIFERTREIGILMAVGVKRRHIFIMILCETVMLTFLGTLAGTALGVGLVLWAGKSGIDLSSVSQGLQAMGYAPVVYPVFDPTLMRSLPLFALLVALAAALSSARQALGLSPAAASRAQ